ncbi:cyclin-like protein [Amylostereum chailletii]|nr:cyclin-like protein [Amylostereum chailletii]
MAMEGHYTPYAAHTSSTKHHHPYFTPAEVEILAEKQRGRMSTTQEDKARQQACGFIEAVGVKIGFPRKTIATAQNLYHRFHLFFPRKDFGYHDVSLAALYVSTKMHDTLKKPREILMSSYAVRFPEQAAKSKSLGGEIDMDPAVVEGDRQRLLAVERLILETICFNFTSRMPFPYVIKVGKELKASKKLTKLAWRLTIDSQRTLAPLQYPPHVVAVASMYLAALLSSFEHGEKEVPEGFRSDHEISAMLKTHGAWERKFQVQIEDLEGTAALVRLLVLSPTDGLFTPSSPSPHLARHPHTSAPLPPPPYKSDQLMRLKIAMRETEHAPRDRIPLLTESPHEAFEGHALGRNEGTVRFLFGPNAVV